MNTRSDLPTARILIVDDQLTHRRKTQHAVNALGYTAEIADSGATALATMKEHRFDLVLLDILMPDMDGFEVMQFMQQDRRLADIPVIVVSALESEMKAVVRAVEMGAEDVLPKNFDSVLLSARLESALERRSVRMREQDTRAHMATLMKAAAKLQQSGSLADQLRLEATCNRDDAVGRLARVFVQMTTEVQRRDQQLQRQLDGFRALGLACVTGIVLGLAPTLVSSLGTHIRSVPSFALLLSATGAILCLSTLLWRRPHQSLMHLVKAGAILATAGGAFGLLPLLWLSTQLPPPAVAGVLPLELAMALVLRVLLSQQTVRPGEILAIVLCFLGGVCMMVLPTGSNTAWTASMGLAAVAPAIGFATATHFLANPHSASSDAASDALATVGIAAALLTAALIPYTIFRQESSELVSLLHSQGTGVSVTALTIVLLTIVLTTGATLRILLAHQNNPITVALSMLCVMAAAPIWSIVLLDLQPSVWIFVALAIYAAAATSYALSDKTKAKQLIQQIDVELA